MGLGTFSVTGGLAAKFIERGELIPWAGVLCVEGGKTGDRRSIAEGALSHRNLPLPLMVQLTNPVNGAGHDGATLAGRIDTIERRKDGKWWGTGFIDPSTADGEAVAFALDKQLMRGISVDLDQVEILDVADGDKSSQVITSARIIGATITPFAAFAEAEISLTTGDMGALAASGAEVQGTYARVTSPIDPIETLIASAGSAIPVDPPEEWFARPNFAHLTPLTVTPNGRVFGHIAAKGTCHISFGNRCQPVPESHTNYAAFRCGSVLTAEGTTVRTGPIVMDTVHPDLRWQASDAQSFYADTGSAVCDVVPYDDQFGIAVCGAMRPDVTPAKLRAFRASDISPDWRTINGMRHECCALLAVNNSGFKLPQSLAASAGMYIEPGESAVALDADSEVYALVASGPMSQEPCCDECAAHAHDDDDDEHAHVELADRDQRVAALRARFAPPPKVHTFRLASAEFHGTSAGARKGWITRKAGARYRKAAKSPTTEPSKPATKATAAAKAAAKEVTDHQAAHERWKKANRPFDGSGTPGNPGFRPGPRFSPEKTKQLNDKYNDEHHPGWRERMAKPKAKRRRFRVGQ